MYNGYPSVEQVNRVAYELQDWFVEAMQTTKHTRDDTLSVSVAFSWGVAAVLVDDVVIWCSEHDVLDEEAGEQFDLAYLKRMWFVYLRRLKLLTPSE